MGRGDRRLMRYEPWLAGLAGSSWELDRKRKSEVYMCSHLLRRLALTAVTGALCATLLGSTTAGAAQTTAGAPRALTAKSQNGKYLVTLRPLPTDGLFAGEDFDIEFFVGDASRNDPVLGPAPVVRAQIRGRFTMPAMPGMPEATSEAHVEGQPGYYGVVTAFPHGGSYLMHLVIRPPADEPFTVQFPLKVNDAQAGRVRPRPFLLQVETAPRMVRAGEPAELRIRLAARQTPNTPVKEFDRVHEQLMHVIIVSRDLGYFDHVHPDFNPDTGTFRLRYTFPAGGEYQIFSDATPKSAGTQVLVSPLRVQGAAAATAPGLTPSEPLQASADGVTIEISPRTTPLKARSDQMLTMTFTAGGRPVSDIQPWLGAMAHLVLIHEDAATFVHSHPQEAVPPAGQPKPHVLNFYARFPKPGLYKGWAQFQRGGTVHTAPFVVRVAPER
jgi:hypothetical protein